MDKNDKAFLTNFPVDEIRLKVRSITALHTSRDSPNGGTIG